MTPMRGPVAAALTVAGLVAGLASGAAVSMLSPPLRADAVELDITPGVSTASGDRSGAWERASRTDQRPEAEEPAPEAAAQEDAAAEVAAAPLLPEGVDEVDFAAGLLSRTVPDAASGILDVVPGEVPAPGQGAVTSVRIEVERGLDIDGVAFADQVLTTLNDPRSWGGDGSRTFSRTAGDASVTVTLASPTTVDRLCAPLDTGGLWSCGVQGRAVLNHLRWVTGSPVYGDDMAAYREYLVNHEVGHVLGHRHATCTSPTALAPVMVQQSGAPIACLPNGWPFP